MSDSIKPDYSKLASYFILDDNNNVVELGDTAEDLIRFSSFRSLNNKRIIIDTEIAGGYRIKTVFTCMNSNHDEHGFPLLWSTGVHKNEKLIDEIETNTKEKAILNHHEIWRKMLEGRYNPGILKGNDIDMANTFFDEPISVKESDKEALIRGLIGGAKKIMDRIDPKTPTDD